MEPLLRLSDVSYTYQTKTAETAAVSHLSFDVFPNEFLGIIGPSGCGKSTILSLIAGLIPPGSGRMTLFSDHAAAGIGYMLQKDHLLEWLSIYDNVTLGLRMHKTLTFEKKQWIDSMLKDYELLAFKNARPSQLSGGMRQRAALIRTLASDPGLLLLDEPFSALDYQTRITVADDIYRILKARSKSAILVTHDISEAISFCSRIIVLTKRPAAVKKEIRIQLSGDTSSPFKARMAPEFKDYFNEIWGELHG